MEYIEILYCKGLWYLKNDGKVRQEWVREMTGLTYQQEVELFHKHPNTWVKLPVIVS